MVETATKLTDENINEYKASTIAAIRANLDLLEKDLDNLDGIMFISCHQTEGSSLTEALGTNEAIGFAAVSAVTVFGEHMKADGMAPEGMPPMLVGAKLIAVQARATLEEMVSAARDAENVVPVDSTDTVQ